MTFDCVNAHLFSGRLAQDTLILTSEMEISKDAKMAVWQSQFGVGIGRTECLTFQVYDTVRTSTKQAIVDAMATQAALEILESVLLHGWVSVNYLSCLPLYLMYAPS